MQIATRQQSLLKITLVLFVAIMALTFDVTSQASVQLGGWLSSKLFERTGSADSQLLFDRTGQTDSLLILATAPVLTTVSATGATISGVTGAVDLNGNLDSLNSMPQADVGFRWGYASGSLTNYTSTTTKNTTGNYTFHLTGYNPLKSVYYQAVGTSDGVGYGAGDVFGTPKAIDAFTGFESIILITPLLLWVATLVSMVLSFIMAARASEPMQTGIGIAIGLILMTVAVLIFPLVITVIEQIRLTP